MTHQLNRRQYCLWIAMATACIGLTANATAREVLIRIVGPGGNAQYLKEGESTEEPVEVRIGDTVVWRNEGNRTHTATAENDDGDLLFDTGDIDRESGADFDTSDPIEMTAALFERAGGQPGQEVMIEYFCDHHSSMESSLVLREASRGVDEGPATRRLQRERNRSRLDRDERVRGAVRGAARATRLRRDISTLSPGELNDYRDAWRRIQQNGDYAEVAGYHGCPDQFCHRPSEQITFLAWHREYVLRMEQALGEPLHYWDWTSPAAAISGIPRAFTDRTYVSRDGNAYPNPLLAYRFTCPPSSPAQTTNRFPRLPSELARYAAQVRTAYGSTTYRRLNSLLESPPHDNVHVWLSGSMGGVYHAAYDPIFWAHHANVDRQWASWQSDGGADPTASEIGQSLRGFSGRTIGHVVDFAGLGYEYDRYDSTRRGGVTPIAGSGRAGGEASRGVGKTFNVRRADRAAARASDEPLHLFVTGIPEHPRNSYFVYVFVDQPDATPEHATPDNPNFVGTFAVFGMGGPAQRDDEEDHEAEVREARDEPEAKRVLQLFDAAQRRAREAIRTVTLVATDETGAIVSRDEVPFDSIRLRSGEEADAEEADDEEADDEEADDEEADAEEDDSNQGRRGAADRRQPLRGGRQFTGESATGSYDDAYQDAVSQAQDAFANTGADRIIETEVISVKGEHGGVAGVNRLKVTIRARVR